MPHTSPAPTRDLELAQYEAGARTVIGLDEVGRGCLAGPVVIGATLATADTRLPDGLRDSKQLTAARRRTLAEQTLNAAVCAIGAASAIEVDEHGISWALRAAALRALAAIHTSTGLTPDRILLDGPHDYLHLPHLVTPIVKGDATSTLMSAASVVAKVHRDQVITEADARYPGYGWAKNMGYAAPAHTRAITELGPTWHHRLTWKTFTDAGFDLARDGRPPAHPDEPDHTAAHPDDLATLFTPRRTP